MKFFAFTCLLIMVVASCSKEPRNAPPKGTFGISVDISDQTAPVPVLFLDDFLLKRSFSKAGGLFDNRHVLRGMSYETSLGASVIVSVGEGPKLKVVTITGALRRDSKDDLETLRPDLEGELRSRFPGRKINSWTNSPNQSAPAPMRFVNT